MTTDSIKAASILAAARRKRLRKLVTVDNGNRDFIDDPKPQPIGLAFSGGGIRSATISLGVTQLLARRGRLYSFDYVSTASGGGYFGSFLRSLFLPQAAKGGDAVDPTDGEITDQFRFAHKVLSAGPKKGDVPNCDGERNPVWWLRENGRYLAPNGATDYLMALSYIARNWTGTLYVIALAMAFLFVVFHLLLYWGVGGLKALGLPFGMFWTGASSPFLLAPILAGVISLGIGVGYWVTQGMRYNPSGASSARFHFFWTWGMTALALLICLYLVCTQDMALPQNVYDALRDSFTFLPALDFRPVNSMQALVQAGFYVGAIVLFVSTISSIAAYIRVGRGEANPTPPVRRWLTSWSTWTNKVVLWTLALAAIDTLAMMLRDGRLGWSPQQGPGGLWSLAIYPAIAFLIKKLPEWFSGADNMVSQWIGRNLGVIGIASGAALYGSMAVLVDLSVQMAFWTGPAWRSAGSPDWPIFILFAATITSLFFMTGSSSGFANLSSLHALYTSRLTRAYLGASNRERMAKSIEVSEGHPKDFIDAQRYSEARLAVPMHLINVTLNETRGGSQLVRRDRKGRRFTVGPQGIAVDGQMNTWKSLNDNKAEQFSVGQLAAISGAAASSAMGRQTSLGAALGLTFANVRLGYWWDRGTIRLQSEEKAAETERDKLWPRPIQTFIYLLNEMTSRYSLDYRHYFLSDGGHSENSGALELLQRRCRFILVSDNGQDEKFLFTDLEIFIRTARIDLGFEIAVASIDDTVEFAGQGASRYFFNMDGADWRAKATEVGGNAFALLLTAHPIAEKYSGKEDDFVSHIIWLKPRIFESLSTDIASYAAQNQPFPHQSTIDQFFDEAQWESYRRLGYEMASRLFRDPATFPDAPVHNVRIPRNAGAKAVVVKAPQDKAQRPTLK